MGLPRGSVQVAGDTCAVEADRHDIICLVAEVETGTHGRHVFEVCRREAAEHALDLLGDALLGGECVEVVLADA